MRLTQVPQQATLRLWGFGISLDQLYVNGTAVPPAPTVDITPYLVQGRNQIAVVFERTTSFTRTINYSNLVDGTAATYDQDIFIGKFDADLDVDGEMVIVRGDDSRFDPRAVWHGVTASTWISANNIMWTEDALARELPHLDYGLPRDPDQDGLENFYEQALMTNPRDADSDNDAVPDSEDTALMVAGEDRREQSAGPAAKPAAAEARLDGRAGLAARAGAEASAEGAAQAAGGGTVEFLNHEKHERHEKGKWHG